MKSLIFMFIALLINTCIIYIYPNNYGYITGGASFGVTVLIILALGFAHKKNLIKSILAPMLGFLVALISLGLSAYFLNQLPGHLKWGLVSILGAGVSYVFYLYDQEVGFSSWFSGGVKGEEQVTFKGNISKILDTSIVIDGRIIDIASTGFIEGPFIVPNFVLREIQLISDSQDPIKRNRGRRGLDMLNQLQKRKDLEVKISYKDYSDTREVDAKLIKLAKELEGKLITNDFNLNKVAQFQGVEVLNINNLANALKPVVLPGEEMEIQVVKEGKDENQGIGYLDDGTMVVIENGGKLLNKKIKVGVTSVIQTNAGKMIFTKMATK